MESYRLVIIEDHMLVELPSGLALIDTGSPVSLGKGPALQLLGREFPANTSMTFVLDSVSTAIGTDVAFLIGNDILTQCTLEMDWRARSATFGPTGSSSDQTPAGNNASVPVAMLLGVPTIKVMQSGTMSTAILDTGAPTSFLPPAMTDGLRTCGTRNDYYPGLGPFSTPVYRVPITIQGETIDFTVGRLPLTLQTALGMIGDGVIIGGDFFRNRCIRLELPHRVVVVDRNARRAELSDGARSVYTPPRDSARLRRLHRDSTPSTTSAAEASMLLKSTLSTLSLGDHTTSSSLGMFPLTSDANAEPGYDLLGDALAAGTFSLGEISSAGSVPEITAINRGTRHVLIVDGEEMIGAKQNRVANLTILVPAGRTLSIPVSCVERGRWHQRTPSFAESPNAMHPRARAEKTRQVSASLERGARYSDQGAVWSEIDRKSAALGVNSPTSALNDVYLKHERALVRATADLRVAAGQVGAVFTIAGKVAGVELFDSSRTYAKYHTKLVRSYMLDALEVDDRYADGAPRSQAEAFLRMIGDAPVRQHPAIGVGEDLRISAEPLVGSALAADERVVHLSVLADKP